MKRFFAFLGVVAVLPFFLPRRSRVVRTGWIAATPDEIFPMLNSLKNWPLWTEWSRKEEVKIRLEGPEQGEGAVQHWSTPRMEGTVRILGSVPGERVSYSLEMDGGQSQMDGAFTLEPVGDGTRVTWACWWVGGENPYTRYCDLAMRLWIGHDFDAGLRNLRDIANRHHTSRTTEAA